MSALARTRPALARLAAFGSWWRGELVAMLPEGLRARPSRRPAADIHVGPDRIAVDRIAGGTGERFVEERPIEALDDEAWAELAELTAGARTRLILSVPEVYWTHIALPAAARGRHRTAAALQLGQIAPVEPAALDWRSEVVGGADGKVDLLVAMAHRERLDALQALFLERGLPGPAIAADCDGRVVELRGERDEEAEAEARGNRIAAVAAALLLLSIPVTTIAAAEFMTGISESRIAALEEEIAPRLAAERRARREQGVRRALAAVFARPAATDSIENIALGLPDTDHAVRAERGSDGSLYVVVETADAETLQQTIEKAPQLASLELVDMSGGAAGEGRAQASFRSAPR